MMTVDSDAANAQGTGAADASQAEAGPNPGKTGPGKGGGAGGNGGGKGGGKGKRAPVVHIRPMASPSSMRVRHWGLVLSFLLLVLLPLGAVSYYLWTYAQDQYASTTGFTVRSEEASSATDLLGGFAQFTGGSGGSDGDVLYAFIQSQGLVKLIDDKLDLAGHYAQHRDADPLFALDPDGTIEDLHSHWLRVLRVSYDGNSGLMELRLLAFDPQFAQRVMQEVVAQSQEMINTLNATARDDALRYASSDLDEALGRLKQAREAMTQFRLRTQIVDPSADLQGRMGILNNLQQQLAQALIDYDLLLNVASAPDPRVAQATQRVEAIRERIAEERNSLSKDGWGGQDDYPTLIAEYESLAVDREFAEETYRAALAAMDVARAEASRQSRYLATYIPPTLAETAEYPQREVIAGLVALFLLLTWAILALVYYSLRDRQ